MFDLVILLVCCRLKNLNLKSLLVGLSRLLLVSLLARVEDFWLAMLLAALLLLALLETMLLLPIRLN